MPPEPTDAAPSVTPCHHVARAVRQGRDAAPACVTIPFFAHLSDRLGRRRVITTGTLALIVMSAPLIWLLSSGNAALVLVGMVLGNPILQATMYGPLAAYISEMLGTKSLYTGAGAGVGYQLGATIGGGFTPLIAASLWTVGRRARGRGGARGGDPGAAPTRGAGLRLPPHERRGQRHRLR